MRIALITPGFSASEQDWCIPALLHLVRVLARSHEVEVLSLRYPEAGTYAVHGARVRALGGGTAVGPGRAVLLVRALWALTARRRRPRVDLVHGLWADEPGFLAVLAGRWLSRPAVVSVMGGELTALPDIGYGHALYRVPRWLVRRSLAGAHRVTVGSEQLAAAASSHVEEGRLRLSPLGVDTQLFRPEPEAEVLAPPILRGAPRLLQVASLTAVKDQTLLLRAMAELVARAPGAHLHLVGDGTDRRRLEALGGSLGLADHLTFHGAVRHELLPAYYRAADIHVISSRHESQCMAVLEAAACGTPTVGTSVGVLPELGAAVRVVGGRDPGELAETLHAVLAAPEGRRAMSRAGLELVRSRFDLARTVATLESCYRELVPPESW